MFYGNLAQLGKKSYSVIRSRSVKVENLYNVLSMEGVNATGKFKIAVYKIRFGPRLLSMPPSISVYVKTSEFVLFCWRRRWAKKEDVEIDTLSEWIKSIGDVLKRRIRRLKHSVNTRHESIFSDPDVVTELSSLHENFVIVPADKASNNYTFVCKRYYVDILIEELGLHLLPGNST